MIGKMKSNISLKDTLDYNIKEHSEIISINNVFGDNWKEIERQMLTRQTLYDGRAQNLTAHIFLSPGIADGKKLTRLDWKEIAQSFLEKASLTEHQSIAFLHQDKEHFHLHIVANRIDEKGNLYRHKNELALSQRLGDEIAKERGMIRAAEIMRERRLAKRLGIIISDVQGSIEKIRKDAYDSAKASFNNENVFVAKKYFENLEAKGYKVKVNFKKSSDGVVTTEISGYSVGRKGERLIKASTLGSEFTLEKLAKGVNQNWEQESAKVSQLKNKAENILIESFAESRKDQMGFDPQNYFEVIRSKGYPVKEYLHNETGNLRGYGIEIEGILFNSSEIGTDFTLTNLKKRATELIQQNAQTQVINNVAVDLLSKYSSEPKEISEKKNEANVCEELIRSTDLVKIDSDLKELTSGHRYKSHNEFISAVEDRGYRVHLRYNLGQLAGLVIHKGTEHYQDKEIGNGKYNLDNLIATGLFKIPEIKYQSQGSIGKNTSVKTQDPDSPNESKSESNMPPDPQNDVNALFLDIESRRKRDREKEKEYVRKQIASEVLRHARQNVQEHKSFEASKFLARLKENGFEVIEHRLPATGILRGYSVKKYGSTFQASELGKDFTLTSLQNLGKEFGKTQSINDRGSWNKL